jgi:hypothetical protein
MAAGKPQNSEIADHLEAKGELAANPNGWAFAWFPFITVRSIIKREVVSVLPRP